MVLLGLPGIVLMAVSHNHLTLSRQSLVVSPCNTFVCQPGDITRVYQPSDDASVYHPGVNASTRVSCLFVDGL